jgi:hypothetical protein
VIIAEREAGCNRTDVPYLPPPSGNPCPSRVPGHNPVQVLPEADFTFDPGIGDAQNP